MTYEFWLSFKNNAERLQLPVNPPELSIKSGSQNAKVSVNKLGEVSIIQDPVLKTFSFESFFPSEWGPYICTPGGDFFEPWHYVETIERWRRSGWPIRFIITGIPGMNYAVTVESFEYSEKGGDVGTVYYSMQLQEYKFIKVKQMETVKAPTGQTKSIVSKKGTRPNPKPPAKSHSVKPGDNLWKIAQRELGSGSKFKEIAKLNGLKPPYIIKPGQKLRLK
jgi:LysM repeat protein